MYEERLLAKNNGYPDPINDDYSKTSEMYHRTLGYLLTEMAKEHKQNGIKIKVMVASHNLDTIRFAIQRFVGECGCFEKISRFSAINEAVLILLSSI